MKLHAKSKVASLKSELRLKLKELSVWSLGLED